MDPILIDMLEPVVVFGTLLGFAFGVKILLGKGPNRSASTPPESPDLERRVAELEARWERLSELLTRKQAEEPETLGSREPS